MKVLLSSGLWATMALAFPAEIMKNLENGLTPEIKARAAQIMERASIPDADAATAIFEPKPYFVASEQYIDVSKGSGNEWVAPGPGDIRGPCPGLNAMANHGFLPHNGYPTVVQFIDATTKVVGMGPNLAVLLAALGGFLDGDVLDWSIGGTPSVAQAGLIGHMGNGISGSHNKYESDASPTRPDLYQYGNDYKVRISQFEDMVAHGENGAVDLKTLTNFRSKRFDDQIAQNKYFFNGPFTGVLVQPAAYTFIYRFMANHSEANPVGLLDYSTLASWFGVTGKPGSYKVKQGYERIPDNWYRRAQLYPYEQDYFLADATNAALIEPKFLSVGGNTGKKNSFSGVNITDLTGGAFNSESLAQGNNLGCFALQFATQAKPDIAANAIGSLMSAVGTIISQLGCPELNKIDQKQLNKFPGYKKSKVDYSL